jgi:hypothetical protein
MATVPLPVGIGCFAMAKREPGYFLLLDSGGATFQRSLSRNGLTQWFDQGQVTLPMTWITGVQCPDPHFVGTDGTMYMYLNVVPAAGGGPWWVARSESQDNGATWTDPVEVWKATSTHFPYMPTVVEYGDGYRMAFSWWCTGTATLSEIHVLESGDGFAWTPIAVPALETGGCGEWDSGSVNRPRLLVDPDGETLHLFYSGYPFDGTVPTRTYAKIGHAVSYDGGVTWCEAGIVLEPSQPGAGWDTKYVGKPTMVWATPSVLRLYFEGASFPGGVGGGLGAAEAAWPFTYQDPCPVPLQPIQLARPVEGAAESGIGLPARITSRPNPAFGSTTLVVDLARPLRSGSAEITLVDIGGRIVKRLWSGSSDAVPARLAWDGRTEDGSRVAAGRYLARLRLDGETVGVHWITQLP